MKYGIEFAGVRRRVRRDWGTTVLTVVTLLALAALVAWLCGCVKGAMLDAGCWMLDAGCSMLDAEIQNLASSNEPLVALAPVTKGAIIGLTLFFLTTVTVLAVRKVQSDRDFYAGLREAKAESEDWMPHALAHEEHERMPSEDLLRIVTALRIEAVAVRDRMSMVVGCLDGLIERMSNDECGMTNDEGRAA